MEKRVKKEIREQNIFSRNSTVCIAVSGGKDSMTALTLLKRYSAARRDTRLIAITVDEGISGYRSESLEIIENYCRKLGVDWRHRSFGEDAGFTMDRLAATVRKRTTCAYCGVFRRNLINALALEAGATKLATGLNLDDTAQSVMMNIARADTSRMAMMGPHGGVIDGLVPRVQPLRLIPENEVLLFAMLSGIPFLRSSCPYSEEASRNLFRDIVLRMEEEMPGTRYSIVRSAGAFSAAAPRGRVRRCSECGNVSSGSVCRTCTLKQEIRALPL